MKKYSLQAHEKRHMKEFEESVGKIMESLEKVKQFKEGDYLVAFEDHRDYSGRGNMVTKPLTNSYGATRKFQVVHIDSNGIPHAKEVTNKDNVAGALVSCLKGFASNHNIDFVLDPDYAEAIILGMADEFDPNLIKKNLSSIHKEITDYNKGIKVNTRDRKQVIAFIDSLSVGSSYWTSTSTQYIVQDIAAIPRDKSNRVLPDVQFVVVKNNKGRIVKHSLWSLEDKNIYLGRPRTYSELKI
jgi:hypothetical protein